MTRITRVARDTWRRVVVLAHAAPTWIAAAAGVVTYATTRLAPLLPDGWAEAAGHAAGYALAWVGAVAAIVRRVTPVHDKAKRGILPPKRKRGPGGRFA